MTTATSNHFSAAEPLHRADIPLLTPPEPSEARYSTMLQEVPGSPRCSAGRATTAFGYTPYLRTTRRAPYRSSQPTWKTATRP